MSDNKPIEFRRMKARHKPKGRMTTDTALRLVGDILGDAPRDKEYLIENIHLVQDATGGLSKDNLTALAKVMNLSFAAVYEVATFYHHFTIIDYALFFEIKNIVAKFFILRFPTPKTQYTFP